MILFVSRKLKYTLLMLLLFGVYGVVLSLAGWCQMRFSLQEGS